MPIQAAASSAHPPSFSHNQVQLPISVVRETMHVGIPSPPSSLVLDNGKEEREATLRPKTTGDQMHYLYPTLDNARRDARPATS